MECLEKKNRTRIIIFSILFLFNLITWGIVYSLNQPRSAEVVFFDIGQGDAAMIKTEEGHFILIDGGPDSGILERISSEMPFWHRRIDLIILSHPHADHLAGLIDVLENYEVENILWTGVIERSAMFKKWEKMIGETDANVRIAIAGQRIRGHTFHIDTLYPFSNLEGEMFDDSNLSSIVNRLVFENGTFLFTGDAYGQIEKKLIEKEDWCEGESDTVCRVMILKSDVLKIGHHGSKTSSSDDFIKRVSPALAVISSGHENRYGHPHEQTLEVLKKYGIKTLRTDQLGNIKIIAASESF